jgi:hypothetical protein
MSGVNEQPVQLYTYTVAQREPQCVFVTCFNVDMKHSICNHNDSMTLSLFVPGYFLIM